MQDASPEKREAEREVVGGPRSEEENPPSSEENPVSDPTRAFYTRQTEIPVPGEIGPSADLYLETLTMSGKAVLPR